MQSSSAQNHGIPDSGKVYLVGAGPGDPGLLTLRAVECLKRADVVLYDYLAGVETLVHAADAEKVCVGKHGSGPIWTQQEINQRLVSDARAGKAVVRLKGGDPSVFGRLPEELAALHQANIPFEIVPGVTASLAVGAYTGISLTDRDVASSVALVTGKQAPGSTTEDLDFEALAKFPGTLVFYMGATTAPIWSRHLIEAGKAPDTPALVIRKCSLPDQEVVSLTLGELPNILGPGKMRPPLLVAVGDVVKRCEFTDWFGRLPLRDEEILITRPRHQAASLANTFRGLGASTTCQPAIEIAPPDDFAPLDQALEQLDDLDWIVFSSANGVDFFFQRLFEQKLDLRALGACKLAAIGQRTGDRLRKLHLSPDIVPDTFRAEALADALAPFADQQRVLLVRASRGREILAEVLATAGANVQQVAAYQSLDVPQIDPPLIQRMTRGEFTWTTVTSSAIARSLVRLFGDSLRQTHLAAISPITAESLRELGHEPTVVADKFSSDGLVEAIVQYRAT